MAVDFGIDHNNNHDSHFIPKIISIIVIGMATTACVVTIFHLIVNCWLKQQRTSHSPQLLQQAFMAELATAMRHSTENSMVQLLIPAHKYQKGVVEMEGEEDGTSSTCAVCLSEYEEGEELRTLPMCMHSFHVPCIDMWLYSHANCPMCRTPLIFFHAPASGSGGPEIQLESSILPDLESPTGR